MINFFGFDLSNANGFNEYQEYMNLLMSVPEPDDSDLSFYEPDDYDGLDIESATVQEMRLQNGDY